jgi:hypothetical protein
LRKFEKTAGTVVLPPGIDVCDYQTFHASIRELEYMTSVEVHFGNATKLVIFQDCFDVEWTDCVVFERYCDERMAFRSSCALELGDRRLSDLELLSLRWAIHHRYLRERSKFASEYNQLRRQCNFRSV